ncbi:MAG: hypothetical protein IGS48_00475 [Oscillatoriales cyanobacterium C42_A2020_001]|nr:hypothetical protein [Leptolyngbyaceae cyanobacterium C42_A2020_001]
MLSFRSYQWAIAAFLTVAISACPLATTEYKRVNSPDGRYTLVVYRELMLIAMPGQGSDASGYFVVRDRVGTFICRKELLFVRDFDEHRLRWKPQILELPMGESCQLN